MKKLDENRQVVKFSDFSFKKYSRIKMQQWQTTINNKKNNITRSFLFILDFVIVSTLLWSTKRKNKRNNLRKKKRDIFVYCSVIDCVVCFFNPYCRAAYMSILSSGQLVLDFIDVSLSSSSLYSSWYRFWVTVWMAVCYWKQNKRKIWLK